MNSPRDVFRHLRRTARRGITVEAAAWLAAAFAAFVLFSYGADRLLRLEVGYRLVLLLGLAVVLARLFHLKWLLPCRVELGDEELALAVERADPGVRQALISAVQFEDVLARGGAERESRELMTAVVDDVQHRTAQLGLERALDRRRMTRFGGVLALALALPLGWAALDPSSAWLWAARNLGLSAAEWPRLTRLSFAGVEGARLRVAEGDDQTLVVRAAGLVPEQVFLHYRVLAEGGESGVQGMTQTGEDEFAFTMQTVLEDMQVWAEGGDGSLPPLRIEVVARPRISDLSVAVEYPAYMQRPAATVAATEGDIRVPRGAVLSINARSSKPLVGAYWTVESDGSRLPVALGPARLELSGTLRPDATGALTLHVVDDDQLDAARPPKVFVRVVEDAPPRVTFVPEGIGSMITPEAVIPGQLSITDDHGLSAVSAAFRVTGRAEGAAPEEAPEAPESAADEPWSAAEVTGLAGFAAGAAAFDQPVAFDLLPLMVDPAAPASEANPVRPGQMVALRFAARDNFGPGTPQEAEGDLVVFRVVAREKLLADLNRRQLEQRQELSNIIVEERADVAELREIVSPGSDDPRADRARLRVLALARKQRALGKRVLNIADHLAQVLDEFENNRLLEPSTVTDLRRVIPAPLRRLSEEQFPGSAEAVTAFARTGEPDVRNVSITAYESIIQRLEQVVQQLAEMENFSTLIEGLRRVIKTHDQAARDAGKRREQEAGSLFDPPGPDSGKSPGRRRVEEPEGSTPKRPSRPKRS